MKRIRGLLVFVALVSVGLFATVASASAPSPKTFAAEVTEDFSPSCSFTCGAAIATPYGPAVVFSELTDFFWEGPCFHDEHTSMLTFRDGSTLVLAVVGALCPTDYLGNFTFSGSFSVLPQLSTRRFGGATGSGLVSALRDNGPIRAEFVGTISRSHQ